LKKTQKNKKKDNFGKKEKKKHVGKAKIKFSTIIILKKINSIKIIFLKNNSPRLLGFPTFCFLAGGNPNHSVLLMKIKVVRKLQYFVDAF
jgi:hypothetical protein